MDPDLHAKIVHKLHETEHPPRRSLAMKFPWLMPLAVAALRLSRSTKNRLDLSIVRSSPSSRPLPHCLIRHQSPLRRELNPAEDRLTSAKIANLTQALLRLDHLVIPPGKTFSFWTTIGQPQKKHGFQAGMVLSQGQIREDIGGGLCQLSNLLHWMFLHAPVKIIERHHHSFDVFPDSGRTLPFGSGATVFYNYVDLKVKNISPVPIQIHVWLTPDYLKGQLLTPSVWPEKYHIEEKHHYFIETQGKVYRYNELYRHTKQNHLLIKTEHLLTNLAPVMYPVSDTYLEQNNYPKQKL